MPAVFSFIAALTASILLNSTLSKPGNDGSKPSRYFFFAAAEISRLFLNNGSHILEPQTLFALLLKSLDAMEHGSPQAVRIKTLFVFAQQEGLPVKQAWLPELDIGLRKQAEVILGSRLSELKELPARVDEILKSLTLWLNSETELKC